MRNLTISQQVATIQAETKQACAEIISNCKSIVRSVRKAIRSCLWVNATAARNSITPTGISRTVYPMDYDKNNPMSGFNGAAQSWSRKEQDAIRDYYECEDDEYTRKYVAVSLARLARIEQEIAMEELHKDALEILVK